MDDEPLKYALMLDALDGRVAHFGNLDPTGGVGLSAAVTMPRAEWEAKGRPSAIEITYNGPYQPSPQTDGDPYG